MDHSTPEQIEKWKAIADGYPIEHPQREKILKQIEEEEKKNEQADHKKRLRLHPI